MEKFNIILRVMRMLKTIYEEYTHIDNDRAFVLYASLPRTAIQASQAMNWHENMEIQFFHEGEGRVLLDGQEVGVQAGDLVVVHPRVIHYTGTDSALTYSALLVGVPFCRQMGIEQESLLFDTKIQDQTLAAYFEELVRLHTASDVAFRGAKETALLLQILIRLAETYARGSENMPQAQRTHDNVRAAIRYIRENYARKIYLDDIARYARTDKYVLTREFKKIVGKTMVEYTNTYRCQQAANRLARGATVTEAAAQCGFENLSFFTKTFCRYMGANPSQYKRRVTLSE